MKALRAIGTDKMVVSLLTNNPHIDMDSDEADEVFEKYLFDYGYVDSTTDESEAYVCAEAEMVGNGSPTIENMRLYITIICHKQYMKLDPGKFKGMIGNRRENLTRYVDKLLNGSTMFGIGKLTLESSRVAPAPAGFCARELTYYIPDFRTRSVGIQ